MQANDNAQKLYIPMCQAELPNEKILSFSNWLGVEC